MAHRFQRSLGLYIAVCLVLQGTPTTWSQQVAGPGAATSSAPGPLYVSFNGVLVSQSTVAALANDPVIE